MLPKVVDAEEVLNKAVGRQIEDWNLDDEGLVIELSDGSSLVFYGQFAIAVLGQEDSLQ